MSKFKHNKLRVQFSSFRKKNASFDVDSNQSLIDELIVYRESQNNENSDISLEYDEVLSHRPQLTNLISSFCLVHQPSARNPALQAVMLQAYYFEYDKSKKYLH